jgi:hypothetical protein
MLGLPNFYWGYDTSNYVTTFSSASPGTNFTCGNTDTYGANVSVISSPTTYTTQLIIIGIGGTSQDTNVDASSVVDILYDPNGGTSWSVLIPTLLCGYSVTPGALASLSTWYYFPLTIPAGSTIGVRAKTNFATDISTGRIIVSLYGKPSKPDMGGVDKLLKH